MYERLFFLLNLLTTQFYIVTENVARIMSLTIRPTFEVKLVLKLDKKRRISRENYNLRNNLEAVCGSVANEVAQK